MDGTFLFRLALSFIVAGTWITLATIIAERFGSRIGGLIGNMPSNILVSSLFIAWTQGAEFAAQTVKIVPLGMAFDSVFLFVFLWLGKKYGAISFLPAFLAWFLMAALAGFTNFDDMLIGVAIYFAVTLFLFRFSGRGFGISSSGKRTAVHYTPAELAVRAAFAGSVVAGAVAAANLFGAVWGGIFATFPAVIFSSMFLLSRSQGADFARSTGRVMLLASGNIIIYAIAVHFSFPALGPLLGTIVSYLAAALFVLAISPLFSKPSD